MRAGLTTLFIWSMLMGALPGSGVFEGSVQSVQAHSTERLTTARVDVLTARYWQSGAWDELVSIGEEALRQGIDFYDLRFRLGVAWHEKRNHVRAIRHLELAYAMSPRNILLLEYLYYAYRLAGRTYEAAALEWKMPPQMRTRLSIPGHNMSRFYLYNRWEPGAGGDVTGRFDSESVPEGYQTLSTHHYVFHTGLEHQVGSRLWLHYAYTHIQRSFFHYYDMNDIEILDTSDKTYVNQFYLAGTVLTRPGLEWTAGVHAIHLLYYESVEMSARGGTRVISNPVNRFNMAGFASVTRRLSYFTPSLSMSVSNLNQATQLQQNATITVHPLGNLNLYLSGTAGHLLEKTNRAALESRLIYSGLLGVGSGGWIWLEASASGGNMRNMITDKGIRIFNDTEGVTEQLGLHLYAKVFTRWQVGAGMVFSDKISRFVPADSGVSLPDDITYSTRSYTINLIWRR